MKEESPGQENVVADTGTEIRAHLLTVRQPGPALGSLGSPLTASHASSSPDTVAGTPGTQFNTVSVFGDDVFAGGHADGAILSLKVEDGSDKEQVANSGADWIGVKEGNAGTSASKAPSVNTVFQTDVEDDTKQTPPTTFFGKFRRFLQSVVDSNVYEGLVVFVVVCNAAFLASYTRVPKPEDSTYGKWLRIVELAEYGFSVFFILDFLIVLGASGFRRIFGSLLGLFSAAVALFSILNLIPGTVDFTGIRILMVLRALHIVPGLKHMTTIIDALALSLPLLRDIGVLSIYFFVAFGIVGVNVWIGEFRRRCVDDLTGIIVLNDQTCSTSPQWGFQCPIGSTCKDGGVGNPTYGTASFDNILSASMTIFQTLTTEGWSNILFSAMDSTTGFAFLYFVAVVIVGQQLLVGSLIAVVSSSLGQKIAEWEASQSKGDSDAGSVKSVEAGMSVKSLDQEYEHHLPGVATSHGSRIWKTMVVVNWWKFRRILAHVVCHPIAERVMLLVTFVSALGLALVKKDSTPEWDDALDKINYICTYIFAAEMAGKLLGIGPRRYIKSAWNLVDGLFTVLGLLEIFVFTGAGGGLTAVRVLRAFRILRISRFSPELTRLINVVGRSMPLLRPLFTLWLLLLATFAIMGIQLFSNNFNFDDGLPRYHFDSIGWAMLSVLDIFTMENWNDIQTSVVRSRGLFAALFPILIVIVGAFVVSQLLLAILISAFGDELAEEMKRRKESKGTSLTKTLKGYFKKPQKQSSQSTVSFRTELSDDGVKAVPSTSNMDDSDRSTLQDSTRKSIDTSSLMSDSSSQGSTLGTMFRTNNDLVKPNPAYVSQSMPHWMPRVVHDLIIRWECSSILQFIKTIVYHPAFHTISLIILFASCVGLALDGPDLDPDSTLAKALYISDIIFATAFTTELLMVGLADGFFFGKTAYLRHFINWIDVLVVVISIICLTPAGQSIAALRVLRIVRVLGLLKLHEGLRIVTIAIWKTIPALWAAAIPYFIFIFIFAILGLSLFVGVGWQCNDPDVVRKSECVGLWTNPSSNLEEPRRWHRYRFAFDNFPQALLSVVVITMQEGWPNDANRYMDVAGVDMQPVRDNSPANALFWVTAEILGSWFFLAVITGLVFDNLKRHTDILRGMQYLTDGQKKAISFLNILFFRKPICKPRHTTNPKLQRLQKIILESTTLENITISIILIDIFRMATVFYGEPEWLERLKFAIEVTCVVYYTLEFVVSLYAVGFRCFFSISWNTLNFIIVVFAILDLSLRFWAAGSSIMIAIRILRVLRSVKIFRYFKAMRSLILAISFNLAQLSNILLLQFIVMFVFAVIGHHAFGTINESATLNMGGHVSFSTFPSSLLLVYILNTGENWPGIMNDCMLAPGDDPQSPLCSYEDGTCGVQWAPVYFLMMQVIVNWVLVNSFVAITMSAFEEFLGSFEEIKDVEQLVDELAKVWSRFDPEGRGAMPFAQIVPFYQQLQIALREVKWMHDTDKPTAQELFRELRVEKNMVKYLPVLSCLVLYWSGHSLPSHNRALRRHLRHLRQITKTSPVDGPDTTTFPIAWSILTAQRHWRGQRERRALIGKTTSTADITDGTQSKASPPATDKMADWVMIAMDKKDTLTPSHT